MKWNRVSRSSKKFLPKNRKEHKAFATDCLCSCPRLPDSYRTSIAL